MCTIELPSAISDPDKMCGGVVESSRSFLNIFSVVREYAERNRKLPRHRFFVVQRETFVADSSCVLANMDALFA